MPSRPLLAILLSVHLEMTFLDLTMARSTTAETAAATFGPSTTGAGTVFLSLSRVLRVYSSIVTVLTELNLPCLAPRGFE